MRMSSVGDCHHKTSAARRRHACRRGTRTCPGRGPCRLARICPASGAVSRADHRLHEAATAERAGAHLFDQCPQLALSMDVLPERDVLIAALARCQVLYPELALAHCAASMRTATSIASIMLSGCDAFPRAVEGGAVVDGDTQERQAARPRRQRSTETRHGSQGILRYLRITPRKVRVVADLIRGKNVNAALAQLAYVEKRGRSRWQAAAERGGQRRAVGEDSRWTSIASSSPR